MTSKGRLEIGCRALDGCLSVTSGASTLMCSSLISPLGDLDAMSRRRLCERDLHEGVSTPFPRTLRRK